MRFASLLIVAIIAVCFAVSVEASDSRVVPVTEEAALTAADAARRNIDLYIPDISLGAFMTKKSPNGLDLVDGRTFFQTNCIFNLGLVGAVCTNFFTCDYWPYQPKITVNTQQYCPPKAPSDKTYINDLRMFAHEGWPYAKSPTNPSDFTGEMYQCNLDITITTRYPDLNCERAAKDKALAAAAAPPIWT